MRLCLFNVTLSDVLFDVYKYFTNQSIWLDCTILCILKHVKSPHNYVSESLMVGHLNRNDAINSVDIPPSIYIYNTVF